MKYNKLALLVVAALASTYSINSQSADCLGNCGTLGADGVVTIAPTGKDYTWISTNGGINGVGFLPGYQGSGNTGGDFDGELIDVPNIGVFAVANDVGSSNGGIGSTTNGTSFKSDAFYAEAGSSIEFYFNYVTSDGSGYADYAWAQLQGNSDATTSTIFTARTKPEGNIVPGEDLPPVNAILNPSSVEIKDGTVFSPLGGDSGACYASGCGHTGWVKSTYTVSESGTYNLAFGVTNWNDTAFDSALAFDGLALNGATIGNGSTADNALLPVDIIAENGAFIFEFTPTPQQFTFIDPEVAVGYEYALLTPGNAFTSLLLPNIGDGIFTVSGTNQAGIAFSNTVNQGEVYNFIDGVINFLVSGIEISANLDPSDFTAFVTGLQFLNQNAVQVSQTPITEFVGISAVPVPAAAPLMLSALGLFGFARRKKSS